MSNSVVTKEEVKTVWMDQIDSLFVETKPTDMHSFLSILTIMMTDKYDEKLVALYDIVNNVELFSTIIDTFSGMSIEIPTKDDFMNTLQIALAYYYREIKKMSWDKIQKEIPYEDNIALKTSKSIVHINKEIKNQLNSVLKEASKDKNNE